MYFFGNKIGWHLVDEKVFIPCINIAYSFPDYNDVN